LRSWTSPRRFLPLLFALIAVFAAAAPSTAATNERYAAIVYDVNSGRTLFSRNADAQRYPASLTKMMTLYILFEELDARRLTLNSTLSVSANAAAQPPSKLGVRAGSTIKVEDAILALVTKSANDVAAVVAENIGGSISGFADRMNRTARLLGMRNTTFRNPHGLPDSRQVSTARDMVLLAQALQDRFPTYYRYFGTRSFTYRGATYGNHNRLLGSVNGVDGIKTGYTIASGFNLVTNVERDGRHLIAVVLGGRTAATRDAHMRELIAQHLPSASRGARTTPMLVAGTLPAAEPRLPRARPIIDVGALLAYAGASAPHDLVSEAMAEAAEAQGDTSEAAATEADPIAERILAAVEVAELAPDAPQNVDMLTRLGELARIQTGEQDIVAGSAAILPVEPDAAPGWHVQIGAVPTLEGAEALLERARDALGATLAAHRPVTQEIEHRGGMLYRARFADFADVEEAEAACAQLKRRSFDCLPMPS
jgi:D-alanyl-D-alanine carboxypeptidase